MGRTGYRYTFSRLFQEVEYCLRNVSNGCILPLIVQGSTAVIPVVYSVGVNSNSTSVAGRAQRKAAAKKRVCSADM